MTETLNLTMLVEKDNFEILTQIKQIHDLEISVVESSRFDGDIAFIPIIITASTIAIKQLSVILQVYFKSKKQIKIVSKGMQITCNSVDEFEKIITLLSPNKKDEKGEA